MRKVFLDDLPKYETGTCKGKINWNKSIGYKVKFIYDDIVGEVEIVDYYPKNKSLMIVEKNKEYFKINISNFRKCSLGNLLGETSNKFKIEIGQTFKDSKRDFTIIDRKYVKNKNSWDIKYYKYKCNKCGYDEGWDNEYHILDNRGCACCSGYVLAQGINDIPTTAPWMVKFFQNPEDAEKYTKSSGQKIKPICPDCGKIKDKEIKISDIYRNKSIGCQCGDGYSYGHKYVFNLLVQLNQYFEDNKKFDWCRFYSPYKDKYVSGEYDFVLKNEKLIIEVDGGFHRKDNKMNGQTKEESKFLDDIKDKLAIKHGYNIIRIYYDDENMDLKDNILNSELGCLFDISNIEWNYCEYFALSNRVKETCEIKKNDPKMTTKEIGEIIKLNKNTIIKYLKKGTELGWCNYDPKEESFKGSSKSGKMSRRQVEIFKEGNSLGVFESASELERQSKELFGIKLLTSHISDVCNGNKNKYKGFTFKYI